MTVVGSREPWSSLVPVEEASTHRWSKVDVSPLGHASFGSGRLRQPSVGWESVSPWWRETIGRGGWFMRSTRGIITRRSCCWVSIQVVMDAISIHGSGVGVGGANVGRGRGREGCRATVGRQTLGVARDSLLFPRRAAARGPLPCELRALQL